MSKKFRFGPVNNKVNIIILVVGVVLLLLVLITKLKGPAKHQNEEKSSNASASSELASDSVSDTKNEQTLSSKFDIADDSNASEAELLREAEKRGNENMVKQAVNQILTLGGSWSAEGESGKSLSFSSEGAYLLSGFGKKKEGRFKVQTAEFTDSADGALYTYQAALDTGDTVVLSAFASDRYTLTAASLFGFDTSKIVFEKQARIVLGSQENSDGKTDLEANRS